MSDPQTDLARISTHFGLDGQATGKLGSALLQVMQAALSNEQLVLNDLSGSAQAVSADTWVIVQIRSPLGVDDATLAAWASLGLTHGAHNGHAASGVIRLADLGRLAARADVGAIQYTPFVNEAVVSGAEAALGSNVVNALGYTGAGIKVGVISDSYNSLGGALADIASGDLPAIGVVVLPGQDMPAGIGTDEGRAMLQIVYDIAPGAQLLFATAFGGPMAFANNIRALAAAGADVITDDVKYSNQLTFTDDAIRMAVDEVVAQGVHYFNSNGNNRDRGVMEINPTFDGSGVLDFQPGTAGTQLLSFTADQTGTTSMRLTWASRAPSVHGGTASADLNVRVLGPGNVQVGQSNDNQAAGFDPFEFFSANLVAGQTYTVEITRAAGSATPTHVQFNRVSGVEMTFLAPGVDEYSATYGHAYADGISVGAVDAFDAPRDGGGGHAEFFSSYGRTFTTHDKSGNAIAATPEIGAELSGVDGLANTFFGGGPPGQFYFYGTSAAAPSIAAVAALLLQQNPNLTTQQMLYLMQSTADNIISYRDEAAFDRVSGAGLVNAPDAIQAGLVGTGIADAILGTPNADNIVGQGANDSLSGQGGDDHLWGGLGADALDGGSGYDWARYDDLAAGVRAAMFYPLINTGGAAGDTYAGIEGLILTAFNDAGHGTHDANTLMGLAGHDELYGQGGNDLLYAGEGNDLLWGGLGADHHDGGNGIDFVRYDDAGFPSLVAALFYPALNTGAAAGDTYTSIEGLILGYFDDWGYGSHDADYIYGIEGNDNLYGQGGNDYVNGGPGNDALWGGLGADTLDGGDGFDYVRYDDAGFPSLVASLANPGDNTGAAMGDVYANIEGLILGYFDDTGIGSNGNDYLYGINGNDVLHGGSGNDYVHGGSGNDGVSGGLGNDTLVGDSGTDTFRFDTALNGATNVDLVSDFQAGVDRIGLAGTLFAAVGAGVTAGEFRSGAGITTAADADDFLIYNTTTGALYYDADGNGAGAAVQFATLASQPSLSWSDFLMLA